MSEINFEIIKNEQSVDELFRMKIELTEDTSDLHEELHDPNHSRGKSEILRDINYNNELLEYLNNRIKDRKQEIYIAEKEEKGRLKRFKDVARMKLDAKTFKELEQESFK
jgi:hypothetical protein